MCYVKGLTQGITEYQHIASSYMNSFAKFYNLGLMNPNLQALEILSKYFS